MADYTLQYPGATIDTLLGLVNSPDATPTASSNNLVKSGGVKSYVDGITGSLSSLNTTAKTSLVAAINEVAGATAATAVLYTSQSLSSSQQAQARSNIGAAAAMDDGVLLTSSDGFKYIQGYDTDLYALGSANADGTEDYILATLDEVHPATASSIPNGGMLPNILYKLGTLTGEVSITFKTSGITSNIENEYKFTFDTSTTAPTITWPNTITAWFGGTAPTIAASKHYEFSLRDGYAYINEF